MTWFGVVVVVIAIVVVVTTYYMCYFSLFFIFDYAIQYYQSMSSPSLATHLLFVNYSYAHSKNDTNFSVV